MEEYIIIIPGEPVQVNLFSETGWDDMGHSMTEFPSINAVSYTDDEFENPTPLQKHGLEMLQHDIDNLSREQLIGKYTELGFEVQENGDAIKFSKPCQYMFVRI